MPGANVTYPMPLVRQNAFNPGQQGVPGSSTRTGLRTHCTGVVFYVDPNYPGTSNARDGTDPTDPLTSVATALTKCQPYRGDVIAVMANNSWQYGNAADLYATAIAEEVTVTVPGVSIVGIIPSGSNGVVWTPASNGGTCITVHAIDVLIEGFIFTEGAFTGLNAIACEWDGVTLFGENLTVRNCAFDGTVDTAIAMEYSWFCDIHHNVFCQNDAYGIYADTLGSGIAYCAIHENIFHDCAIAMSLLGGSDNNHIWGNRIYNGNAQGGGAATNEGINTTGGDQNMVTGNWFSCLLPVGAGDWNDLNTAAATDAWVGNYLLNGMNVTNPT